MISYDCTRKLTENDKLKVLKSKLKSQSRKFYDNLKSLISCSFKRNLTKNMTVWVAEL